MALGTVLVSLFALVGVLALTGLLLYYLAKWIKTWKKAETPRFPSDNYMRVIGSHCPDYWIYKGRETRQGPDGKPQLVDICENTFGVDVPGNCYDTPDSPSKTKTFQAVNWDKFRKSSYGKSDRCFWIRNCGPKNSWADWTGIAENC